MAAQRENFQSYMRFSYQISYLNGRAQREENFDYICKNNFFEPLQTLFSFLKIVIFCHIGFRVILQAARSAEKILTTCALCVDKIRSRHRGILCVDKIQSQPRGILCVDKITAPPVRPSGGSGRLPPPSPPHAPTPAHPTSEL